MHNQRQPRMGFHQPHPLQHFQRDPNFVPRGMEPRFGYYQRNNVRPSMNKFEREHWCETCDRSFPSLNLLEQHKQQHQKCNIDGCQFIAHPNVITKHIQMQHCSGLFSKIGNLKNPEDIRKWREERKKKYPTKGNILKKQAEINEKIKRGEKMGLKRDAYKKFNRDDYLKRKLSPVNQNDDSKTKKITIPTNVYHSNNKLRRKVDKKPPPEKNKYLKPFSGVQNLLMDNDVEIRDENEHCNYEIVDDDDCVPHKEEEGSFKIEEPSVCGALSALMCEYKSSDDELEIKDQVNKTSLLGIKKNAPKYIKDGIVISQTTNQIGKSENIHSIEGNNVNYCDITQDQKNMSDDDSAPEEIKVEKPVLIQTCDSQERKNNRESVKNLKLKKKPHYNYTKTHVKKPKPKSLSTLLHKLLQREIHQERNIVLQCIRHIVQNNYFDK